MPATVIERWQRIKELLHHAMSLERAQRAKFLDEACSCDAGLRAEVESLLSADEAARSSFLQSSGINSANADQNRNNCALRPGEVFANRFQLIRKLGEGGMGQVWLAEQTSPVQRQVALKLIRPGLLDELHMQRFQSERQSLAIMDHPAIAKVFDAGATAQGEPYLVMEYVRGQPITEYCDQKKLGIPERLELLIRACEGVQHAHQKAIIHRDLKPANILVVEVDGKPTPRIIDFGLAKAITAPLAGESLFTQLGYFVGTPAYMSPEQADPNVQDIDTRTDVYSLGVVLYVLLAGLHPFDARPGQKQSLDELLRRLREEEPLRPSAKVSEDRDTSRLTAEVRNTEPRPLVSLLHGELDWITVKALEKDRARPYGAPSELAADIRRYLNHEPVVAGSKSAGYRLRRYTRRHRALVTGVVSLFLVLIAGIAATTSEAIRAQRANQATLAERDRATAAERIANEERDRAKAAQKAATEELDRTVRAERASAKAKATAVLERNRAVAEKHRADEESGAAKAINDFLQNDLLRQASLVEQGPNNRPDPDLKVRTALERAAARIPGKFEGRPLVEAAVRQAIGTTYVNLGLSREAQVQLEKTLELLRRVLGENHPKTATAMNNLAVLYMDEGRFSDAQPLVSRALEIRRRVLGDEDRVTLVTLSNLGSLYRVEARYEQAELAYRRAIEIRSRVLGENHRDTAMSKHNLALLWRLEGKYAEGERLEIESREVFRRVLGEENPVTLRSMENLAALYYAEQRYQDSEALCDKVLAVCRRTLGAQNPETTDLMAALADAQVQQRKYALAEPLLREALSSWEKTSPDSWKRHYGEALLGASLAGQNRYTEAEPLLVSGYQGMLEGQAAIPSESRRVLTEARERIVAFYENWGKPEKAIRWREQVKVK